ncbi:hypothetical protein DL89DRAFT_269980, partial [Linderina pennispora]
MVSDEFDSSASESDSDEDQAATDAPAVPEPEKEKEYYTGSMLKPLLVSPSENTGAFYVTRMKLPIMEAITENPVITTQAGYGDPNSQNPGMIGSHSRGGWRLSAWRTALPKSWATTAAQWHTRHDASARAGHRFPADKTSCWACCRESTHGCSRLHRRSSMYKPASTSTHTLQTAARLCQASTSTRQSARSPRSHTRLPEGGILMDDFEIDSEEDSEEEDELIMAGRSSCSVRTCFNAAAKPKAEGGDEQNHPEPLYCAPPAGSRLCVVATNVAETSITIPGIRYVVDAGLAKEKTYDAQTQVQNFDVRWTSQASANQRTGRAGRTGPGHSYRLFSSAVFNDQFPRFSVPEIMRMPIEGVVLQMKAMNLDNVVNFPFPTPPNKSALTKAERLLTWLGALDAKGRVTDLGRLMSVFPVAPRFAKMLIVGQQHECLPYIIAIVAALSVGDPFLKDGEVPDEDQATAAENRNLTNAEVAAKEHRRLKRRQYWRTQSKLSGSDPSSDVLKWLTVVGAFEYAGGTKEVCEEYYVRQKAMIEIRKLRAQLTNLVQMYCPGVDLAMDPQMPPHPDEESNKKKRGMHAVPYVTMWSEEPVFVHPETIVFSELQRTTRLWAKIVTIVSAKWLATIGQPLCSFGNPLPYPLPKYNDARDHMTCYVEPRFGPKSWLLP